MSSEVERGTTPAQAPWPGPAPQVDARTFNPRYKSPVLAAVLSVVPGLGQVYVGYYTHGFIYILTVISLIALGSSDVAGNVMSPALGFFVGFFWLFNIVDAGRRAAYYNHAVQGGDVPLPGALPTAGGGSTVFGAVLVVAGGILLAHTAFGMPIDWIERWWPVAPIGVGAYLVFRGVAERREKDGQ